MLPNDLTKALGWDRVSNIDSRNQEKIRNKTDFRAGYRCYFLSALGTTNGTVRVQSMNARYCTVLYWKKVFLKIDGNYGTVGENPQQTYITTGYRYRYYFFQLQVQQRHSTHSKHESPVRKYFKKGTSKKNFFQILYWKTVFYAGIKSDGNE